MDASRVAHCLLNGDVSIFDGQSAGASTGWLTHLETIESRLQDFDHAIRQREPRHGRTILLGMGGSSAPAAMMTEILGGSELQVLDTSNPDSVSSYSFDNANVVASSKSGSTIELVTTLAWAFAHGLQIRDLTVITDPGTSLDELAKSMSSSIFYGDPRTGGRYSALSAFGLVPALISGCRPQEILATVDASAVSASAMTEWIQSGFNAVHDPNGASFFSMSAPPVTHSTQLWLEQLVAESTGKLGRGVVPIVDSSARIDEPQRATLVSDIFRWHVQVSAMALALGVDPFNQPDVQLAKTNLFEELRTPFSWHGDTTIASSDLVRADRAEYVALQFFAPVELENDIELLRQRAACRFSHVTASLGPRFLHSSGQLHKGGPSNMVAIQVSVRPKSEPARISGRGFSFHDLHFAQARADARALRSAGRTVVELSVESLDEVAHVLDLVPNGGGNSF